MMISVRRVVSMEPQVIVVAGSNDHLQSKGLLSRHGWVDPEQRGHRGGDNDIALGDG